MKNKITIEEELPELKKEDLKAAAQRRENYASKRDIQAAEYNRSITQRLARDKQNSEG